MTNRPCGPQEIAILHAYPTSTAWRWRGRGVLVAPSFHVSGHEVWELPAIETWSRQTGRYQPAIERWTKHLREAGVEWPGTGELTFSALYDLLALGTQDTRVAEVGMPPRKAEAA